LAEFLKLLPEPCRISYLPLLHEILNATNPFNWRLRQSLAVQLPDLVLLPPAHLLYNTLFPLIMTLLQDPVASVRNDSFKGVSKLINVLNSSNISVDENANSIDYVETVANSINELILGETYQLRQLWLELSRQLLSDLPIDLFERLFLPGILQLTLDNVCNVRLSVAFLLTGWAPDYVAPWGVSSAETTHHPWVWLLNRPDIKECVYRLSSEDNDIYLVMIKLAPFFPSIEFRSVSCRGLKRPPGGTGPIKLASINIIRLVEEASSPDNILAINPAPSVVEDGPEGDLKEVVEVKEEPVLCIDDININNEIKEIENEKDI